MGILSLNRALEIARERNLDLVEVAPTAEPPVCRILDYGKFRYEQTRKQREARKHQKTILLKEIRLRPKIDDHDMDFKGRLAERFLKEGDKVKLNVLFRGREMAHPQLGKDVLDRMLNTLKDLAVVEKPLSMEGRNMSVILTPILKQAREEREKEGA